LSHPHPPLPRAVAALVVALVVSFASFSWPSPAAALPPGIPSASAAQSQLAALTVRAEGSMSGYSREAFPHWVTVSGACNAREEVLRRDGTNVVVDGSCAATSGSWYSHYDGITEHAASDIDIDHVVPLAEAWRSGASGWATSRRQSFANSLATPQLLAVTDDANSAKGDRDPASWRPSRTAFHCTYARMWIGTKYQWGLSLQAAEKSALQAMLNSC
jgi:hypothetical protein